LCEGCLPWLVQDLSSEGFIQVFLLI